MTQRRASSVPAVEAALVTRLQARTGLQGCAIKGTLPRAGKVPDSDDKLYFIGVEGLRRDYLTDQHAKRETYLLPLWVETYRPSGDDPAPAHDRFWQLVEEVEAELADDPELANVADDAWVEEIPEVNSFVATDGWVFKGVLFIRVLAVV